ncbi:MAG: DUF1214 domain-containing protein [Steroidobacteraceae bacterium]
MDRFDEPRLSDGTLWREVARTIEQLQKLVLEDARIDSPLLRAEGMRYLTRLIAGVIPLTMDGWDSDYPTLIKFISPYLQYGIPAADCCYHTAAVHGDHVYRIHGQRGTSRLFDIESREGHTAHLAAWKLVDRRCDFTVDAEGYIEVVLSTKPQPGNWVRIPAGPGSLIVRQYFYDWLTELPALLAIDRIGATYPPPPLTPKRVTQQLELLIDWLRQVPVACQRAVDEYFTVDRSTMKFTAIDFAWRDIQYGKGTYRCGADEAVILEVTPPPAPWWSIQLTSHFWEALDWNLRQTSINGHQAVLDADGKFRAVISHVDPGVPNWLDAGGHEVGLITARYYKAESTPLPQLRHVALGELRRELPAATPVVTPRQRQVSLWNRAQSVPRRLM